MNPIEAETFRFSPRNHSAATPPTSANGTFVRISTPCAVDPNVAYSSPKMIATEIGSTIISRRDARS